MELASPITGPRIYLRHLTLEDATPTYAAWLNDPLVTKFLDTKGVSIAELQAYIAEKNAEPDTLFLGMFENSTDRHIGTIKLDRINQSEKKATVALMIGDTLYWGGGYAKEAIGILAMYAFTALGIHEIYLGTRKDNEAARKAYVKTGFKDISVTPGDPRIAYDPKLYNDIVMVLDTSHAPNQ